LTMDGRRGGSLLRIARGTANAVAVRGRWRRSGRNRLLLLLRKGGVGREGRLLLAKLLGKLLLLLLLRVVGHRTSGELNRLGHRRVGRHAERVVGRSAGRLTRGGRRQGLLLLLLMSRRLLLLLRLLE
jgi:hypothetical protein